MIADAFSRLSQYLPVLPHSRELSEFLAKTDLGRLETGRHAIAGDAVYVLIQEYRTKPEQAKPWESHRRYIDLQVVLSGAEYMGWCPVSRLTPAGPYDEANDFAGHNGPPGPPDLLYVPEGHFCIFFPEDGHKPGLHTTSETPVRKAVIKIAVS